MIQNFSITITGTGECGDGTGPQDPGAIIEAAVRALDMAGHHISHAAMITGARENTLTKARSPAGVRRD